MKELLECEKTRSCLDCELLNKCLWEQAGIRHRLSQEIEVCPVCGVKLLKGKQETCSPRCRKILSRLNKYRERSNGKPKKKKRETGLMLSLEGLKKLGRYLTNFKSNARPNRINSDRMRQIEAGRAKLLTAEEIRALWETYPDLLPVLLGIRF